MFDAKINTNVSFPMRLENTDGDGVEGLTGAELTILLANDESADWEQLTDTTHYTLNELSEGDYTLIILSGVNDTFGPMRIKVTDDDSLATVVMKQYVANITELYDVIGNIGSGGVGATNHEFTDDNVLADLKSIAFVGTQAAGTFLITANDPDTYHQINNDGGNIDIVYKTNVGGNKQAVNILFQGFLDRNNTEGTIRVYDFLNTAWDIIYTLDGQSGSNNVVNPAMPLLSKHTGTDSELGDVYVRFTTSAQALADLFNGVMLVEAVDVSQSVGYADGRIWINTLTGEAGTIPYTHGTADNPVLTWADALTLSASVGLPDFHIDNGSTIILSGNSDGLSLVGDAWILNLNSKSISALYVEGAVVSGVGTGAIEPNFRDCHIGDVTFPPSHFTDCINEGDFTVGSEGDFFFDNLHSGVAGLSTPSLDYGAVLNASQVNMRNISGGMTIKNMGQGTGSYNLSIEGRGQLILDSSIDPSTNPVIAIRGAFDITDNVVGGFVAGGGVLSQDARYNITRTGDALDDYDGPTNAEMNLRTLLAAEYGTLANQVSLAAQNAALAVQNVAILAAVASAAADITIIRELRQNKLEIDIDDSKAYIWNDASGVRKWEATLTDNAGDPVTASTAGPINSTKFTEI